MRFRVGERNTTSGAPSQPQQTKQQKQPLKQQLNTPGLPEEPPPASSLSSMLASASSSIPRTSSTSSGPPTVSSSSLLAASLETATEQSSIKVPQGSSSSTTGAGTTRTAAARSSDAYERARLAAAAFSSSSSVPSRPSTRAGAASAAVEESDSGSSAATEAYNSEDEHGIAGISLKAVSSSGADSTSTGGRMLTPEEREARFREDLARAGYRIAVVRADGNCLFRALARSLCGDEELHALMRARVMDYVAKERDYFSQFIAEDFARYIRRKRRDGTHGNHLELQAAAELLGRSIEVYAYSLTPITVIDTLERIPRENIEPLRLSFHRGNHYNSVIETDPRKSISSMAANRKILEWNLGMGLSSSAMTACEADLLRADTLETEAEIERAVRALSIADARRGFGSAAASSSAAPRLVPSSVRELMAAGFSEEQARDAYRAAGHGGISAMVGYLTTDWHLPKHATRNTQDSQNRPSAGPSSLAAPAGFARNHARNTPRAMGASSSGTGAGSASSSDVIGAKNPHRETDGSNDSDSA